MTLHLIYANNFFENSFFSTMLTYLLGSNTPWILIVVALIVVLVLMTKSKR